MVDSKVIGNLNDLIIPKFEISGIGLTKLHPVALRDINKTYFDLNIGNFESGAKDLAELLPKETILIPSSCLLYLM
jgi:hypothetical protein